MSRCELASNQGDDLKIAQSTIDLVRCSNCCDEGGCLLKDWFERTGINTSLDRVVKLVVEAINRMKDCERDSRANVRSLIVGQTRHIQTLTAEQSSSKMSMSAERRIRKRKKDLHTDMSLSARVCLIHSAKFSPVWRSVHIKMSSSMRCMVNSWSTQWTVKHIYDSWSGPDQPSQVAERGWRGFGQGNTFVTHSDTAEEEEDTTEKEEGRERQSWSNAFCIAFAFWHKSGIYVWDTDRHAQTTKTSLWEERLQTHTCCM